MTLAAVLHRYARLRAGRHVAIVTRVQPETGAPCYIVEAPDDAGAPAFTRADTWRAALELATTALARAVRVWP